MGSTTDLPILLIRAGMTQWEECGRVAGAADLPLCDAGRRAVAESLRQVVAAGVQGGAVPIATILHGPEEASRQTAELLAGLTQAKLKEVSGLKEMSLGLWEGRLVADLQDKCKAAFKHWTADPSMVTAPEGEGAEDAQSRLVSEMARALGKVRPRGGAGVAIVMRPLATGLVRAWLDHQPMSALQGMWKNQPVAEWRSISRQIIKPWTSRLGIGL